MGEAEGVNESQPRPNHIRWPGALDPCQRLVEGACGVLGTMMNKLSPQTFSDLVARWRVQRSAGVGRGEPGPLLHGRCPLVSSPRVPLVLQKPRECPQRQT